VTLRVIVTAILLLTISPAVARVLPIDGAYGNEAGCASVVFGEPKHGLILLTLDPGFDA
jgi:hypothetical protein